MADTELPDLTAATALAAIDVVYAVVGGLSRKITEDNLHLTRTGNRNIKAYASLSAAVTALGSTQSTIEIGATTTVSATLTVPSNITLLIIGAGLISVSASQTLTINGPIQAPQRQIFTGSGLVVVNKQTAVPHWYGASVDGRVVTDGAMTASGTTLTSATAAFTSAMVGWLIDIEGSGTSAADSHSVTERHNQVGTITGYTSATQVTVSFSAVATVSAKQVCFGPDDSSALSKAFASARSIYFPPGTYAYSSGFTLTSNRRLSGDGQGVSILRHIGPYRNITTGIVTFAIPDGAQNITIENLSILGTNKNRSYTTSIGGISFVVKLATGASGALRNLIFRNLEVGYIWGQGFRSDGDAGDQSTDPPAIGTSTIFDSRILDCFVHHCAESCVNFNNQVLVSRCTLVDSWNGIEVSGSRVLIADNYIARNESGISLGGYGNPDLCRDMTVTGNLIERNGIISASTGSGMNIGGNVVNAIVANNIVRENQYQGLSISDGTPDFSSLSRDIRIVNNRIVSNGSLAGSSAYVGIYCDIDGVVIEGNDIYDGGVTGFTQAYGIIVAGHGVKLLRNNVHGNTPYDYVAINTTNLLLVRDDPSTILQQYGPNGYTGTVDTSTTTATWKSGHIFSTNWVGVPVTINSVPYLITAVAAAPTGNFTVSGLTVTRSTGPNFDTAWVGKYIKLGPSYYFPISAVGGVSTMTITNPIGVTVPASGVWALRGSVSATLGVSAGTQSGVTFLIPPHVIYPPDNAVMQTLTFSATPVFDAAQGNTMKITLSANVTSSTLANGVDGQVVTLMIIQDPSSARTFAFPSNVVGSTAISATLGSYNIQSFVKSGGNWYAGT